MLVVENGMMHSLLKFHKFSGAAAVEVPHASYRQVEYVTMTGSDHRIAFAQIEPGQHWGSKGEFAPLDFEFLWFAPVRSDSLRIAPVRDRILIFHNRRSVSPARARDRPRGFATARDRSRWLATARDRT